MLFWIVLEILSPSAEESRKPADLELDPLLHLDE
jgi:hypothetical protein